MDILADQKLVPAVTLTDVDSSLYIAEALLEGGVNVMEITFRTAATAPAISKIASKFPMMTIGAGTILSSNRISVAKDAGAQFGLAPGYNDEVVRAARKNEFPFIPGVITPSEIEKALANEINLLKLFPVNCLGGEQYVKSLQGPYRHTGVKFIPMGGVNRSNMENYLYLPSVAAIGGSWLVPDEVVANRQFGKITSIVRQSVGCIP